MPLPRGSVAFAPQSTASSIIQDGITQRIYSPWPAVLPGVAPSIDFSAVGDLIAMAHNTTPFVTIHNTSDWSKIANPSVLPGGTGSGVAFSPDGTKLAVSHSVSPFITIYNTAGWAKISDPATLPTGNGLCVAFSPDNSMMAVGHLTTPFLTIYNTSDWSKIANPATLPTGQVNGIMFSPDGTKLAVVHNTSPFVTIYNTSDWSKIANPSVLPGGTGNGAAFSPDGTKLAVCYAAQTPFLRIYRVSDWSGFNADVPSVIHSAPSNYFKVAWADNSSLYSSNNGNPGLIKFNVTNSAATVSDVTPIQNINGLAGSTAAAWKMPGTINESLAVTVFRADAYDYETNAHVGTTTTNTTTFEIPLANPNPVRVTVTPSQGNIWKASTAYGAGATVFPTNPESFPYYYVATVGGISSATEPSWPIAPASTVADGTVTWQNVERLVEPESKGPRVPIPA